MAPPILLKRSTVPGKIPLATDLQPGELAINLADRALYSKDVGGVVFDLMQGVNDALQSEVQRLEGADASLLDSINTLSSTFSTFNALLQSVLDGTAYYSIHAPDDYGDIDSAVTQTLDFGSVAEPVTAVEDLGVL